MIKILLSLFVGVSLAAVTVGREGDRTVALLTGEDAAKLWKKMSMEPAATPGGFGQMNYMKSFESGGEAPKLAVFCYDFHGRGSELFCRVTLAGSSIRMEGAQARALRGALRGPPSFATSKREVEISCEEGGPCAAVCRSDP